MGGMIQKAARFLRIGQLPDLLRTKIGAEGGFLWLEEGILVTAILRDFKAPGTFCGYPDFISRICCHDSAPDGRVSTVFQSGFCGR